MAMISTESSNGDSPLGLLPHYVSKTPAQSGPNKFLKLGPGPLSFFSLRVFFFRFVAGPNYPFFYHFRDG